MSSSGRSAERTEEIGDASPPRRCPGARGRCPPGSARRRTCTPASARHRLDRRARVGEGDRGTGDGRSGGTTGDAQDLGDLGAEDDEGGGESAHADVGKCRRSRRTTSSLGAVRATGEAGTADSDSADRGVSSTRGSSCAGRAVAGSASGQTAANNQPSAQPQARNTSSTQRASRMTVPVDATPPWKTTGSSMSAPAAAPRIVPRRRATAGWAGLITAKKTRPATAEGDELRERERLLSGFGGVLDAQAEGLESAQRRLEAEDDHPPRQDTREPLEEREGRVRQAELAAGEHAQQRGAEHGSRGEAGEPTA